MNAYTLASPLAALMQPQPLPRLPLAEAIRQHIDLLLATRLGECRYDPQMGSAVWQGDYAAITNPTLWKGETEQTLAALIQQYEKRIRNARVAVDVDELEEIDRDGVRRRARKRLTIRVNGTLIDVDEPLPELHFILYINPVASQ
ncbi:GPW/gp25 family protein [Fibrella forsythiae]|uniref:GPW/gp25 family protein n=1 Tax=Fibrella forsythiae TaxID=2817061 RepID=A0ABS3JKD6_9BACT|nr:GPW/gp25 family protein [Fibrella forsythiae]MBO0950450.1 GPW/gp25 family protein [Fibrella forsythiae]